jgi:hypothetical protein
VEAVGASVDGELTGADDGPGLGRIVDVWDFGEGVELGAAVGRAEALGVGTGTTACGDGGGVMGSIRAVEETSDSARPPATIAETTTAASPETAARMTRCRRRAFPMTRS